MQTDRQLLSARIVTFPKIVKRARMPSMVMTMRMAIVMMIVTTRFSASFFLNIEVFDVGG